MGWQVEKKSLATWRSHILNIKNRALIIKNKTVTSPSLFVSIANIRVLFKNNLKS